MGFPTWLNLNVRHVAVLSFYVFAAVGRLSFTAVDAFKETSPPKAFFFLLALLLAMSNSPLAKLAFALLVF